MTSEKQNQANVINAQLSTGPITQEGKEIVSKNAVKHGIFAKDLVINTGDGRENEMEYQDLLAGLKNDFAPVGRMEMMLVEKIAVNYWRLRRLVRYETGRIRERLDNYQEVALRSFYNSPYNTQERPVLEYWSYDDEITDTEFQNQLHKVISLKSSDINLSENKDALVYVHYYRLDNDEPELTKKDYKAAKNYIEKLTPQMQGKLRKEMLDDAKQELAEMNEVRTWQVKFDLVKRAKSLPLEKDITNIIKYETSLERSIFRNLAALKVLQENRANSCNTGESSVELPAAGS